MISGDIRPIADVRSHNLVFEPYISHQMNFELWFSSKDGYAFFQDTNASARDLLSSDASLVAVIDASDWDEAQTKKHELLGWDTYRPVGNDDPLAPS